MLAVGMLLVAYGSAVDYGHNDGQNWNQGDHNWDQGGHNWNHDNHDWLSPGGSYYSWYYPTTYYSDWYYTPAYTYTAYPTYYYTTPTYYTTPVYYTSPIVYSDWIDPWWGANVYGFGGTTHYYTSSSWTYHGGFGFGDP